MRLLPNGQRREIKVFNPAELLKILHRRDPNDHGEVSGRAFELFGEGRPIREVVIALRQTPERIEELHDQSRRPDLRHCWPSTGWPPRWEPRPRGRVVD